MEQDSPTLLEYLEALPDPRVERTKLHKLVDIVFIAVCAVVSGADTWEEIADYGRRKEAFLRRFIELPNGIPSHDTFNRVFAKLDAGAWQACFLRWVEAVATKTGGQVVAIDGKTLRASRDGKSGTGPLKMVSAWAGENRLVLGQVKVEEGESEITAVPELLELLELEGCVVTLDAFHCQRETAQKILDQGGEYVLAVKGNQGKLFEDVQWLFNYAEQEGLAGSRAETFDAAHGRYETRRATVIADVAYLSPHAFPGLTTVVKVSCEREAEGKLATSCRYYLTSLAASAKGLLRMIRRHWGIENNLHWVLDMAFREDQSRARTGQAAPNMATLRHFALNLLRSETTAKGGIKRKRFNVAIDDDYLLLVLGLR